MNFIPDGFLSFDEAIALFSRWLRGLDDVSFDGDEHLLAEAQNQLRQALAAGDLVADTLNGGKWGQVRKSYWLDDRAAQKALGENVVRDPRPYGEEPKAFVPVFLSREAARELLFGKRYQQYSRGRRRPYRLLSGAEGVAVTRKPSTAKGELEATRECREHLMQDAEGALRAGALKELPAMQVISGRAQDRVIGVLRSEFPYISDAGAPRKKSAP